jgi:hypothetical protein
MEQLAAAKASDQQLAVYQVRLPVRGRVAQVELGRGSIPNVASGANCVG